jgi:hypothetical protein
VIAATNHGRPAYSPAPSAQVGGKSSLVISPTRTLGDSRSRLFDSAEVGAAVKCSNRVLATSLYEDPSAGLHEDASARLREHPALLGCSILRRTSPPSSAGGHQHPAGGHEEGTVAITESDRILGHCTAGQRRSNPYSGCSAVGLPERACRSAGLALVSVPCPGLDVACGPLACSSRRASKVIADIAADHSPNPVVASFRGGQAAKRC